MPAALSPLLASGLILGILGAATPLLLRLTRIGWLRLVAVPMATVLFTTSFTLVGNGPLLRPLMTEVVSLTHPDASGRPPSAGPAPLPPVLIRQDLGPGFGPGFGQGLGPAGTPLKPLLLVNPRSGEQLLIPRLRQHPAHPLRRTRGAF